MILVLSTQIAVLVLAMTALATSGCGKSSATQPLTKAEIVAKANVICARFFMHLHAHGTQSSAHLAENTRLLASDEKIETDELRKLIPPNSMKADWKRLLEANKTIADDSTWLARDVKDGKLQTARSLLATGSRSHLQALEIAQRYEIRECARST